MYLKPVEIEDKAEREGQKTRSFSADILAMVTANKFWEFGSTEKERTFRPVFLAYAATDQEARAVTANMRLGRPLAENKSRSSWSYRWEIPRSAGFRYETHSRDGATLTLAYLPSIFAVQPGTVDLERIEFVSMPPTWWVDQQAAEIAADFGPEAREAAVAAYFVAYLDLRSPLPIANDLRFHLELFKAAKDQPWCLASSGDDMRPGPLYAEGVAMVGFEEPVAVQVTHDEFALFLAEHTAKHLPKEKEEVIVHGSPRIPSPRRILPDTRTVASQLGLFG